VLGRLAPFTSDEAGEALRSATAGAVEAVVAALRAHVFNLEVQGAFLSERRRSRAALTPAQSRAARR